MQRTRISPLPIPLDLPLSGEGRSDKPWRVRVSGLIDLFLKQLLSMDVLSDRAQEQAAADEFDCWWHCTGLWVEPANQRRGGESGVQLLLRRDPARPPMYCKRQTGHLYRTLLHPFGRPTILRELQAYRTLARMGIGTPRLIYGAARRQRGQWQALLVTEALQGFISLEHWYAGNNDTALARAMLRQLAITLARLHLAGWQHGCCYPKHIFVRTWAGENEAPRVEIALLDLEKAAGAGVPKAPRGMTCVNWNGIAATCRKPTCCFSMKPINRR